MKKNLTICCPKCGYEYLPEEIYYPKIFVGSAKNIVRDDNNKIIFFEGESMNTKEEFTCDNCGCTFNVEAKVLFETKVNTLHDFSEEYSVSIYKDRIELEEPDTNNNNNKGLW